MVAFVQSRLFLAVAITLRFIFIVRRRRRLPKRDAPALGPVHRILRGREEVPSLNAAAAAVAVRANVHEVVETMTRSASPAEFLQRCPGHNSITVASAHTYFATLCGRRGGSSRTSRNRRLDLSASVRDIFVIGCARQGTAWQASVLSVVRNGSLRQESLIFRFRLAVVVIQTLVFLVVVININRICFLFLLVNLRLCYLLVNESWG